MAAVNACSCCLTNEHDLTMLNKDTEDVLDMLTREKVECTVFKRQVCPICSLKLSDIFRFKELCLQSARALAQCISDHGVKTDSFTKVQRQSEEQIAGKPLLSNVLCVDVFTSAVDGQSTAAVCAITRVGHPPRDIGKDMTTIFKKTSNLQEEETCTFPGGIDDFEDSLKSEEDHIKTEGGEIVDKLENFLLNDENLEYLSDIKMELSDDDSAAENVSLCQLARLVKKQTTVKRKRTMPMVYIKRYDTPTSEEIKKSKSPLAKRKKAASYVCPKCGKLFRRSSLLKSHSCVTLAGKRTNTCPVCDRTFASPSKLKEHMLDHSGERPFSCEECGKTFKKAHILKGHLKTHLHERPFPCDLCSSSFLFEKNLQKHRKMHTGDRPHVCKTCGKSFVDKTYLKRHEMIHMDEIAFTCDECGMSFAQLSKLNYHKLSHKDERPFSCEECGKAFKLVGQLNNHRTTHSGVRPYTCEVCGRSFRQAGNFNCHKRVHTGERPYTCSICGNTYTEAGYLKKHIRIHTGEKPFSCDVCGKSFIETCGLRRHKLVHTGEQRYSCSECGALFKQPGGLRKHKRKHLAEKLSNAAKCRDHSTAAEVS